MSHSYEEAVRLFRWHLPDRLNMAVDAVDRQACGVADGHRTALITESADGTASRYSFIELMGYSNRLAHLLVERGVGPGDRVALLAGASAEAAVGLLAILKAGAVAVPLSPRLPAELLVQRLARLNVVAAIGEASQARLLSAAVRTLPGLSLALTADATAEEVEELWTALCSFDQDFLAVETMAEDPALLLHHDQEPGATLYGHKALRARAPGLEYAHQGLPHVGDLLWTPADWNSEGGWLDAVLPAWSHGVAVVASPASPEALPGLPTRTGLRNVWLPAPHIPEFKSALGKDSPHLRTLVLAGEASAADLAWLRDRVGAALIRCTAHPALGPMLCPSVLFKTPPGALGRPVPGYALDVIDDKGKVLPAEAVGAIALHADSPLMPLGTLGGETLPHLGRWMPVGGRARKDLDGTFWPDPPMELPPAPALKSEEPFRLQAPDPKERWRGR